ncbi:MAG: DNA mismatch repair protein MutS [Defluviitaleaceae bacterium]|nr:DNA mismatch repair protein MutS [Defluviitaleaceae bacterium]MCL2240010.1 DNA mismatch repair protein MutS [Defluviitaleaceae bacterium]
MKENEFSNRVKLHEATLKKHTAISDVVGYGKLFAILVLGLVSYFLFAGNFQMHMVVLGVIIFMANITLWVFHYKLHQKIKFSNSIIAINKRHLDRISGKWSAFSDIGAEFINHEHQYASDLDIVGKKSFFQFLNTTHTWHGRQSFANDLLKPDYTARELTNRQKAIAELSTDIDFSNRMEHGFSEIGLHRSMQKLVDELKDSQIFIKNKILKYLLMYMPLVTFIAVAGIVIFRQENLYVFAVSIIAMQALIWIMGMLKTHKFLSGISRLPYKLSAYSEVIGILKSKDFDSEILNQIQAQLGASEFSAEKAIKDLGKISDKVNVRHNIIIWFVLNVLLLWDIECSIMFEKWKMKYASVAEGWFLALGEFESLLCFSNLPNICSNTCLPSVTNEKEIKAQSLGHPLIPNGARVNNDIVCKDSIFIISGSNMSGKTTFMRTVGINMVLARAGSFVCAKTMAFPLIEIMTSMRVADDLNEGISTFYAELKRIRGIIALAEKEPRMIFLIDEIFRGTNSVDRLSGAKSVLSKLNKIGALGIITTHDLELCEIANQYPRIKNYSFSEEYRNNQIHFDYKIKHGKSTTTNAKYLMKMVGIDHTM